MSPVQPLKTTVKEDIWYLKEQIQTLLDIWATSPVSTPGDRFLPCQKILREIDLSRIPFGELKDCHTRLITVMLVNRVTDEDVKVFGRALIHYFIRVQSYFIAVYPLETPEFQQFMAACRE